MTTIRRTVTFQEFDAQLQGGRRIGPGLWLDAAGDIHWSVPELLALVDLEDTPEHREAVAAIVERTMRDAGVSTIIRQDPPGATP